MHNVQSILHCVLMYYVHSYEGGWRTQRVDIDRIYPYSVASIPQRVSTNRTSDTQQNAYTIHILTHRDSIESCEQMKWQEDERIQFYLQQFSINHVLLIHNSVLQRRLAYHISSLKHICKLGILYMKVRAYNMHTIANIKRRRNHRMVWWLWHCVYAV